jgi:FixJ family two-component response regulator
MSESPAALVNIVDDDPSVRKGLARLVKSAGYRVEVFESAGEFLARPPQEDPSCLVLDVRMPGLRSQAPPEAQVFALVVTGMLNKQVAAELGIVEKTVKAHRARVMEKMRAGSLAKLVRRADRAGIIAKP